jgi:catechol 2,3-dioxygenase-like lactoylglutathione lyase family enzyme
MMQLSIVSLAVADQKQARRFYVDLLGCKVQRDHDTDTGRRWSILQLPAGSTRIALIEPTEQMPAGSSKGLILKTLDIDNVRERLMARGLAIGDIHATSWGRYAAFNDPDGNGWVLAESLDGLL